MSASAHRGPTIPETETPKAAEPTLSEDKAQSESLNQAPAAEAAPASDTTPAPETTPTPTAETTPKTAEALAATQAAPATDQASQPAAATSIAPTTPPPSTSTDYAATPSAPAKPEEDDCGAIKNEVQLPLFLKDKPALLVSAKQICKNQAGEKIEPIRTNLSVIGVSCTGAPGIVTRRGHSNQNWELVTFAMDMSCQMPPADDIKVLGKKKLGIEADPHLISYVPMMIEYWEFETNNDAGLGTRPALTAAGGGAAQWKKNEAKNVGFPIKLYGRSSTFTRDQSMYEVDAVIKPRTNQRQFEVTVQNMKQMTTDEMKSTLDRCRSKVSAKAGCDEAFTN